MSNSVRKDQVLHLLVPEPGRASRWVASHLAEFSSKNPDEIRELFELGAVYLNKKRLEQDVDVDQGDYLRVHFEPRRYNHPGPLKQRIVYEDESLWILDKPAGIPCHPTVNNRKENLLAWLSEESGLEARVTHRLDIGTSGLIVVAKTSECAAAFNRLLVKNLVEKLYEARVEGHLPPDIKTPGHVCIHYMEDDNWAPRRVHPEPGPDRLECRLEILSCEMDFDLSGRPISRLRLRLQTGRTHQIRAQMGALGHPVLNDVMYGAQPTREDRNWWDLRCRELQFPHPFDLRRTLHFARD